VSDPERLAAQLGLILERDGGLPGAQAVPTPWSAEGPDYLARRGVLLTRDRDAARVREVLGGNALQAEEPDQGRGVDGLTVVPFIGFGDVEEACRFVDERLGVGVATPDHVLHLVPTGSYCPATEPEPVHVPTRPYPEPPRSALVGAGVRIAVLDSGLVDAANTGPHDWMNGVMGDLEDPFLPGTNELSSYASHGLFSAGVARTMAPGADVYVYRAFDHYGAVYENYLATTLARALASAPDIVSLSFGTHSRLDIPLLGIDAVLPLLEKSESTVMVAAAGNDSSAQPFWPAAYRDVVGVGALSRNWNSRAWFTNHGKWVDVYAPGEDLVNAFATGPFRCIESPDAGQLRNFDGMARWSGTSFATPMVAGMIAARMSTTGENARQAATGLLHEARSQAVLGVGPILTP
jgi:Subtilase family